MLCVKVELISTRLLSDDDKKDMRKGLLPVESLITHVKVWIENGMPDYANGQKEPYKAQTAKPMRMYAGYGKR